jgi:16S rRNA (uracil1498-N3)-methyltransferase
MDIFYCTDIQEDIIVLGQEESHHCIAVLRYRKGDRIKIVNGKGLFCEGIIQRADPMQCRVELWNRQQNYGRTDFFLHIAIAPVKSHDRFEWFLEKATEIGIHEISPVICRRSERKTLRRSRAEKILLSAMKQSGRAYLPKFNDELPLKKFMQACDQSVKMIAHCSEGNRQSIKPDWVQRTDACILIGPEGDFTDEEIMQARQHGFKEISLGDSVLRTETAGLVACTLVNYLNKNAGLDK